MTERAWQPGSQEIDPQRPSAARMYDWYLGGHTNDAIDREFGENILEVFPIVKPVALANRQLLHRIVRHLTRLGIRQFVDVGSGVPTMGNVHQVADELVEGSRVVYVDNEPIAVAHARTLLADHGDPARHAVIHADLRSPEALWAQVHDTGIIEANEPIGLLFIAVLHFVTGDGEVERTLATYRDLLPSGSYLAISHASVDHVNPKRAAEYLDVVAMYDQTSNPVRVRTWTEVGKLFGDLEPIDPGLCWAPEWHPEHNEPGTDTDLFSSPDESVVCVGVARKH